MYENVRRACKHLAVGPDDVRVADDGGGDGHAAVGFRQQHRVVTVVFALANLINNIYNTRLQHNWQSAAAAAATGPCVARKTLLYIIMLRAVLI